MANPKFTVLGTTWTFDEAAAAEVAGNAAELAEALALSVTAGGHPENGSHNLDGPEFEYSATAEDNGIAGILDLEPGLVFAGPTGLYTTAKVEVVSVSILEGTIAPEATDEVTLAIFVNSAIWAIADEGYVTAGGNSEVATEFNVSASVALTELDVVRVAVLTVNGDEAGQDWDIDTLGVLNIT